MPVPDWRLLVDPPADGPWNMAVDEAVARAVGEGRVPPTLRFYRWASPHVSLGYLQRARGGADLDACRRRGIGIVRRATGGRAVLHAEELTYSVAVPLQGPWRHLSVAQAFGRVCGGLVAGLRRLGVAAHLGEATAGDRTARAGACFLAKGLPAVLVGERKLVGSAQRRFDRSLLQHGSLLLDFDPGAHLAIFPDWPRIEPAAGITSLRDLLGSPPAVPDLVRALADGWSESVGAACVPGALAPGERTRAAALSRSQYGTDAWTFGR